MKHAAAVRVAAEEDKKIQEDLRQAKLADKQGQEQQAYAGGAEGAEGGETDSE